MIIIALFVCFEMIRISVWRTVVAVRVVFATCITVSAGRRRVPGSVAVATECAAKDFTACTAVVKPKSPPEKKVTIDELATARPSRFIHCWPFQYGPATAAAAAAATAAAARLLVGWKMLS